MALARGYAQLHLGEEHASASGAGGEVAGAAHCAGAVVEMSAGTDWWRLTVSATSPVRVMSLMLNPRDGFITNVSSERLEP